MKNNQVTFQEKYLPQEIFAERLAEFRSRLDLSYASLARIFAMEPNTSQTTLYRLEKNLLRDEVYEKVVPIIENRLYEWMIEQGHSEEDIQKNLVQLFEFQEKTMIINRCEMTATAVKFFGLDADPFDVDRVPGDDEIFTNNELDDIANRVKDAVLYKRFVCVSGSVGTGKTSMKIRIARELEKVPQKVRLIYPDFFDMNAVSVSDRDWETKRL